MRTNLVSVADATIEYSQKAEKVQTLPSCSVRCAGTSCRLLLSSFFWNKKRNAAAASRSKFETSSLSKVDSLLQKKPR